MPDIKIKRYADKENLKKLMKYSKDTFANKNEINDKFYTKEQIDTMLESGSGGGGTGGDYYTKSEIDTKLNSKANTSDLSTVAASGDYNDLINEPNIRVNDDGSLYVERSTDGNFFRFTHTGWSTSGSNAWGGMYFRTSNDRNVFGFAARQTSSVFEKFTVGNNGYLRGYDTKGYRTVTLVINGGTADQPDTQNITVDGTFINAGDQKPYSANMYTIGTSDMPYKSMYARTFVGNVTGNIAGNASTATKATQDSDGNQINTTYSKIGHTHDDRYYTESEVNEKFYTKKQIDILLKKVIVNQQVLGGAIYDADIDEYNNETEQTMKTVSVVEPTSVNAYTIVENSDTVEEL